MFENGNSKEKTGHSHIYKGKRCFFKKGVAQKQQENSFDVMKTLKFQKNNVGMLCALYRITRKEINSKALLSFENSNT